MHLWPWRNGGSDIVNLIFSFSVVSLADQGVIINLSLSDPKTLRKWFSHDPAKWKEFMERDKKELKGKTDLIEKIRGESRQGRITLLFSAKDEGHNNAVVLKEVVEA